MYTHREVKISKIHNLIIFYWMQILTNLYQIIFSSYIFSGCRITHFSSQKLLFVVIATFWPEIVNFPLYFKLNTIPLFKHSSSPLKFPSKRDTLTISLPSSIRLNQTFILMKVSLQIFFFFQGCGREQQILFLSLQIPMHLQGIS